MKNVYSYLSHNRSSSSAFQTWIWRKSSIARWCVHASLNISDASCSEMCSLYQSFYSMPHAQGARETFDIDSNNKWAFNLGYIIFFSDSANSFFPHPWIKWTNLIRTPILKSFMDIFIMRNPFILASSFEVKSQVFIGQLHWLWTKSMHSIIVRGRNSC